MPFLCFAHIVYIFPPFRGVFLRDLYNFEQFFSSGIGIGQLGIKLPKHLGIFHGYLDFLLYKFTRDNLEIKKSSYPRKNP